LPSLFPLPQIRLYVLRASNLAGHDDDNLSDPFLVVKLGNKTQTTRDRYKHSTRDPRFFECFEFQSKLPGINDILISVKDHNDFKFDELIGSTVIDLEDRYYFSSWRLPCAFFFLQ
jgi:Ca2+-dependent lipid-binding protein